MKKPITKTQSAALKEEPQRVEILTNGYKEESISNDDQCIINIKREENDSESKISILDPVKIETTEVDIKCQERKLGALAQHSGAGYYCQVCNKLLSSKIVFTLHLTSEYHQKRLAMQQTTPDVNDPNDFCCVFNKVYKRYRKHLKELHKMDLPNRLPKPRADIQPDINDPNHYCKSCEVKYANRASYRLHLRHTHKINNFGQPKIEIDTQNPSNTTCAICRLQCSSENDYQQHIKYIHREGRGGDTQKEVVVVRNPNIQPDPNDPNLYCSPCQKFFSRPTYYLKHIQNYHPKTKLDASINPRNKWCVICRKDFFSRCTYLTHMKRIHKDDEGEKTHTKSEEGEVLEKESM